MYIDIKQTKSNMSIEFEMHLNRTAINFAKCSRINRNLPIELYDTNKTLIYSLVSDIKYNAISSIPFSYLLGLKKYKVFKINNFANEILGEITGYREGFLNSYHCITFNEIKLIIYSISKGTESYYSVYKNNNQIAMIVKNSRIKNNLDYYRVYSLDERTNLLNALKLYVLYIDNLYFSDRSEVVVGKKEVTYSYSYSKTNKYYDENWLMDNFNEKSG